MRRLLTTRRFYFMAGIALIIPVLMLVMSNSIGGGEEAAKETISYLNAWQAVESISGESSGMGGDMLAKCNVNMMFFMAVLHISLFITDDFKIGYSKNLFTVRAKKTEYFVPKWIVGVMGGALMIVLYIVGTMVGGAIAGLPLNAGAAGAGGVVMCILTKIMLMGVFVPVALFWSTLGKQKIWLAIGGSFAISLMFFMMIPSLSPLDSGLFNVVICLIGGALFTTLLGAVGNLILNKTALV